MGNGEQFAKEVASAEFRPDGGRAIKRSRGHIRTAFFLKTGQRRRLNGSVSKRLKTRGHASKTLLRANRSLVETQTLRGGLKEIQTARMIAAALWPMAVRLTVSAVFLRKSSGSRCTTRRLKRGSGVS